MTIVGASIAVIAIVAGCGGGGDSSSTTAGQAEGGGAQTAGGNSQPSGGAVTTSSLSKQEFVKRASAACTKERKGLLQQMAAYVKKGLAEGKKEKAVFDRMVQVILVPSVEAEIAAVRQLGAPEGDEEQIAAMLAAQQEAVADVKKLSDVEGFEQFELSFIDASNLYREYGLEACAKSQTQ